MVSGDERREHCGARIGLRAVQRDGAQTRANIMLKAAVPLRVALPSGEETKTAVRLALEDAARHQLLSQSRRDVRHPGRDDAAALRERHPRLRVADAAERMIAHRVTRWAVIDDDRLPVHGGDVPTEQQIHHRRGCKRAP